ncbi:DUF7224 domain-containing protein [Solicola gregarius]|uniref:DUF7224 domain-containing protein n=1 Tax=Solicola gregarius TaxID=2908642 RepID=A0AA46TIV7_9ACTN|nr:hypothetical protein [Solicola gregarius]UYM06121.1 hypothetical protein L0C25_03345 [Solicola gregarius]
MPISALFRTALAFRLSPLFVLAMFGGFQGEPGWSQQYALAATSHAEAAIWVLAPLAAMCAAWEGYRLRRSEWLAQPRSRHLAVVVGWALVPVIGVAWAAFLSGIVLKVLPSTPDLRVTGLGLLILLAWITLGFGVGLNVHAVIALPTVLVAGYCWFAFPPAFTPFWMRHVTGDLHACCSIETDLAPMVPIAVCLVAAGLSLGGFALVRSRTPPTRTAWWAVAPVPVIVSVALAAVMVDNLGPAPAVRRDVAMSCHGSNPEVCVYPEREGGLSDLASAASASYRTWARMGFDGPAELSEARAAFRGATSLYASTDRTQSQLTAAVVEAVVPRHFRRCDTAPAVARSASRQLAAWLALTAEVNRDAVRETSGRKLLELATVVSQRPDRRQRTWVARQLELFGTCQPDGSGDRDAR